MTLVELMVAIAIFIIGIEGFAVLYIRSLKTNAFVIEMGEASVIASRGVQEIVDSIRRARQADNGSYPIILADEDEFIMYNDIDNDNIAERVRYYVEDNKLKMGISRPTGTPYEYPAEYSESYTLVNYVANSEDQPIFAYFNQDYPADEINNPLEVPADMNEVRMVKIHLMINIDPDNAPDYINIQSFAAIRNLNEYDRAN